MSSVMLLHSCDPLAPWEHNAGNPSAAPRETDCRARWWTALYGASPSKINLGTLLIKQLWRRNSWLGPPKTISSNL